MYRSGCKLYKVSGMWRSTGNRSPDGQKVAPVDQMPGVEINKELRC